MTRNDLQSVLEDVARDGVNRGYQDAPLAAALVSRGFGDGACTQNSTFGVSDGPDSDAYTPNEQSEAPRFVRGFHDVLISLGVIIALGGLTMIASVYALIPAVIVLAEILIKRQRLALPAFVLTIAFVIGLGVAALSLFDTDSGRSIIPQMLLIYGSVAAGLLPYYWRYRVPVALAALILSAIALVYFILMYWIGGAAQTATLNFSRAIWLGFVFSLLAFCVAMWFDMRDRLRENRYSDVAFWLHLGVAPVLLNSALGLVLSTDDAGRWMQNLNSGQAAALLAVIAAFMMTGLVIDRRAFVTAGLLSLGYALSAIIRDMRLGLQDLSGQTLFGITALAVGIVVLALGIGWQPLRQRLLALLPGFVRSRMPPAQRF